MPSDETTEKPIEPAIGTAQALSGFLARLSPNREEAGLLYNKLRQRVVFYLENRGAVDAQEMADDVMDRVCVANAKDKIENISGFALGTARYVRLEYWRKRSPETELGEHAGPPLPEETVDFRMAFLEACLGKLCSDERELVLTYHEGEKGGKIADRLKLGEKLGLSPGAVRTRAHRVRQKLEDCIERAMKKVSSRNIARGTRH